jgi:hypothetical protein
MKFDKLIDLLGKAVVFATREDVQDVAKKIWAALTAEQTKVHDDTNPTIVSKALHRMNAGRPPRIALAGMTSAGKSSLANALFGSPIAEVRRTPDTTDCVLEVKFPSGLVVYDTPGLFGNGSYENITRAVLGLDQDPALELVQTIPFVDGSKQKQMIPCDEIRKRAPLPDVVVLALDADRTMSRHDKAELKAFHGQLVAEYPGRLVAAATKDDDLGLGRLSVQDRDGQLANCRYVIGGGPLLPISAFTGAGLGELVVALFQALPDIVSLSKMQESLRTERRLGRLAFVISEAAGIVAEMAVLTGKQVEQIHVASFYLFASICKHYEVDEDTWMKLHGNAAAIGATSQEAGVKVVKKLRDPRTFFETIQSWFGKKFEYEVREFERIGIGGIAAILPGIYALLREFSESPAPVLSEREIASRLRNHSGEIDRLVAETDRVGLAAILSALLTGMLAEPLTPASTKESS